MARHSLTGCEGGSVGSRERVNRAAEVEKARQSIDNLRGEIEFREKLARQHVSGEVLLPDYYGRDDHVNIIRERVRATQKRMRHLQQHGLRLSPFLELGAERGQRSLVLTNDFGALGVAVDISFHQLRTTQYFAQLLRMERLPVRICCDANHLPFKSKSFPFVFCYEFLHHFPSLHPIVSEIDRILANGCFFFDEEPFKHVLKVVLYKQKNKIYAESTLRKNKYLKLIESFISEPVCDEIEHGIIENNNISLKEWVDALAVFGETELDLLSIYNIKSSLHTQVRLRNVANYLLGGLITGLCHKRDGASAAASDDIDSLLACPNCTITTADGGLDRPGLIRVADRYRCPSCGFDYPTRDGIIVLLPSDELQQLYPELCENQP
jgi:SAM-dependent methyltransferase